MRRFVFVVLFLVFGGTAQSLQAQKEADALQSSGGFSSQADFAATYGVLRTNLVGGDDFYMKEGTVQVQKPVWRYLGAVGEFSRATGGVNNLHFDLLVFGGGPRVTVSNRKIALFAQGLAGQAFDLDNSYLSSTSSDKHNGSLAIQAGGGVDWRLSRFFSIRLAQVSWMRTQLSNGGSNTQDSVLLNSGIVFHSGTIAPLPRLSVACSADPSEVFAGEPVSLAAAVSGQQQDADVSYSWSGKGVSTIGANSSVDTTSLVPGTYTVNCVAKETRSRRRNGPELQQQIAEQGFATFAVKEFQPPTVSCSIDSTSLKLNDHIAITAVAVSPQNRPLSFTYWASAGSIDGQGSHATFYPNGFSSGPVSIICSVSDDKGHRASAHTSVSIAAPQPSPSPSQSVAPSPEQALLEHRLALHSVFFPPEYPREENPAGGLRDSQKATLDSLATDFKQYLQLKPDAHLFVIGHTDSRGAARFNSALAHRRAFCALQFLIERGVPAANIEIGGGNGSEQQLSSLQVNSLIEQNTDLNDTERQKIMHNVAVVVLAQNRRVDIVLSTTGLEMKQMQPFNAADTLTLLNNRSSAPQRYAESQRSKK